MNRTSVIGPEQAALTRLTILTGRQPSIEEKKLINESITKHISNTKPQDLALTVVSEVIRKNQITTPDIKQTLINQLEQTSTSGEDIFTFGTLDKSQEASINSILGMAMIDARNIFNPQARAKKTFILLDRRFAETESPNYDEWKWNFINNTTIGPGSVNAIGPIRDVISMKVYDYILPFTDNSTIKDRYQNYINSRITLFIKEFQSQSFIGPENRRFHFMGVARDGNSESVAIPGNGTGTSRIVRIEHEYGTNTLGLNTEGTRTSAFNNGVFTFREPITTLTSFTISFANPFQIVPLEPAERTGVFTGTAFQWAFDFGLIIDEFGPSLNTFSAYLSGFTTTNPITDAAAIANINRPQGWRINTSGFLFPLYGEPDSVLSPPGNLAGTPLPATGYIGPFRFTIPIELTYLGE